MGKYEIIIYWSAEDEAFIAEVPELPDVWRMARIMMMP
jgi:predicted RNase H-like HicB family nuclease